MQSGRRAAGARLSAGRRQHLAVGRAAMASASDSTLREALAATEDSLKQARADAWGAFDALVESEAQRAVDMLVIELEQRIGPLVGAVMRLGGDPRLCWAEWPPVRHPPAPQNLLARGAGSSSAGGAPRCGELGGATPPPVGRPHAQGS
jgi:hypothetical protein